MFQMAFSSPVWVKDFIFLGDLLASRDMHAIKETGWSEKDSGVTIKSGLKLSCKFEILSQEQQNLPPPVKHHTASAPSPYN